MCEGPETAAAIAYAFRPEIAAGELCVAAAITAGGLEAFPRWPSIRRVTIAADRDEQGRPGKKASRRGEQAARRLALRLHGEVEVAIALPGEPETKTDYLDLLLAGGPEEARRSILEAARFTPKEVELAAPPELSGAGRVIIELIEAQINDIARQCAALLVDEVYLRGSLPRILVRVEDNAADRGADAMAGVKHAAGSQILVEPSPERLQFRLDEHVAFCRWDDRKRQLVAKSCPLPLARRIIAVAPELGFRHCAGIVAAPLFMAGEVVTTSGYHALTQTIIDLAHGLPSISERPSRAECQSAMEILLRPFRGYVDQLAGEPLRRMRCALAAAALTAALRPSLLRAPAIVIDANQSGAGKGKLGRALGVIVSGGLPAIITEGHSPEELEKRLDAAVLSGASALLLDNLQRHLASSTLESLLSEGIAEIRPFGQLATVKVPCAALILLTANNASMRADMLRRVLPVRIVVATDQPELRRFGFDPVEEATRDRRAILAAALTIARGWWQTRDSEDGRRIRRKTLGSFEPWAELVAGSVEWLLGLNPIDLIEQRKADDPRPGDERRLFAALAEWQAIRSSNFGAWWKSREAAAEIAPELWAGVVAFKTERPSAQAVSEWLKHRKEAVRDGRMLRSRRDRTGTTEWSLQDLQDRAGPVPCHAGKMADGDSDGDNSRKGVGNGPARSGRSCKADGEDRDTAQTGEGPPAASWSVEL